MRLAAYFIFAYLMLGIQAGIGAFLERHGASFNLALIAVLFISLNAPRNAALLGSFGIGFLQDLLTAGQPGIYAFSYGLVAVLVAALGHVVNREHLAAHFVLALFCGLLTALVVLLHGWIHPAGPGVRISVGTEFLRVLYTAILAPILLFALGRIRGVFAFQPGRKRARR